MSAFLPIEDYFPSTITASKQQFFRSRRVPDSEYIVGVYRSVAHIFEKNTALVQAGAEKLLQHIREVAGLVDADTVIGLIEALEHMESEALHHKVLLDKEMEQHSAKLRETSPAVVEHVLPYLDRYKEASVQELETLRDTRWELIYMNSLISKEEGGSGILRISYDITQFLDTIAH